MHLSFKAPFVLIQSLNHVLITGSWHREELGSVVEQMAWNHSSQFDHLGDLGQVTTFPYWIHRLVVEVITVDGNAW